jgi:cobalt-precorrin 5A hydrolase
MIIAGIGCRRGASADAVLKAVQTALELSGLQHAALSAFAIPEEKNDEAGIHSAARKLSLRVILVSQPALVGAGRGALTASARVMALKGVPSVAEAAALAAAGDSARLLAPRSATASVTCALATGAPS